MENEFTRFVPTHPTVGFTGHLDCFTLIGASLSTAHLANSDHLPILTHWDGAFQFRASTRKVGAVLITDMFQLKYEATKKTSSIIRLERVIYA